MKVLITKDEHLQLGFRNKFRKPGWEKDLFFKHNFIIQYMKENNIKYKITTGDILDSQKQWSFKQFLANKRILEMYKENNLEVLSIAGNHDMVEGRMDISDSPFEEMVNDGLIKYINTSIPLYNEDGVLVAKVNGLDYRPLLNKEAKENFLHDISTLFYNTEKIKILVIHQNVTPVEERVTEFTYDEISKVCQEKGINVLICGHYHIGFPTTIMNDVIIINPWNLWRVVRDHEVRQDEHKPEFVVLDLETLNWEHNKVPYKKYQEAFNLIEVDTYQKIKKQFSFIENVNLDIDMDIDEKNILNQLILKLKEKGVEEELLERVLNEVKLKIDLGG